MESPELVHVLDEENAIQLNEAGEYELTDLTRSAIQDERSTLQEYLDDDREYAVGGQNIQITNENIDYFSNYSALERITSQNSLNELAKTAFILTWFQRGMPETDGSPDRFLPIHGDHLAVVETLYSPAIVYIWRFDCRPCDMIQDDLERLTDEIPSDELGLFSIYGPEDPQYLRSSYDVVGAPTMLFVVNGSVDSRLQGAHEPQLIRRELETIRERHRSEE